MRIAVTTWTDRRAGGVESYLEHVLPELLADGHQLSLWHEASEPAARATIALPDVVERFPLAGSAPRAALAIREWRPDIVLGNGLASPDLEQATQAVAPSVFVAHNYHGTCISGTKCWTFPARRPCTRTFGAGCLACYYPHRCGGLSPTTMVRLYRRAADRLRNVRASGSVVTLSEHMRREYVWHGLPPDRVTSVPYGPPAPAVVPARAPREKGPVSLVSIGRLEPLKGVDLLLAALPAIAAALRRPVRLRVVGHGSMQAALRDQARALAAHAGDVSVAFDGWLAPADRDAVLADADLHVAPAPWPEPFGMTGLEAAHLGVPTIAFDVGAVGEWLIHGRTGWLARGTPPSATALADTIVEAMRDPAGLAGIGSQAREHARTRSPRAHATMLGAVLRAAARRP